MKVRIVPPLTSAPAPATACRRSRRSGYDGRDRDRQVIRVPSPGGLCTSRVPSTAATRSREPEQPGAVAGSAPPTPSSATSSRTSRRPVAQRDRRPRSPRRTWRRWSAPRRPRSRACPRRWPAAAAVERDVDAHRDRRALRERGERRAEAALGEDRRVDAAGQLAQLVDRQLQLVGACRIEGRDAVAVVADPGSAIRSSRATATRLCWAPSCRLRSSRRRSSSWAATSRWRELRRSSISRTLRSTRPACEATCAEQLVLGRRHRLAGRLGDGEQPEQLAVVTHRHHPVAVERGRARRRRSRRRRRRARRSASRLAAPAAVRPPARPPPARRRRHSDHGPRHRGAAAPPSCTCRPSASAKSDSTSYGVARAPYTSRLASRWTRSRTGWNATATTAVAATDSHTDGVLPADQRPRADHDGDVHAGDEHAERPEHAGPG